MIEELELNETYGSLAGRISVAAVDETQVMKITVNHTDRNTAEAVAAKLLEIAPDIILNTVEAGSVKVVERAYALESPISPNIMRNTVLAAIVGCFLSCAVVIFIFLLDNTFKSELDIQNQLGLPVLGVIPAIECCNSTGSNKKLADMIKGRR